jgi:FkbM family methyltransferase
LRRTNAVLAITAVVLLAVGWGRIYRTGRFWLTGTATVAGLAIYLDPKDRLITDRVLAGGEWEPGEMSEFRRLIRPGDTVIDVGANVGWYTLLASSLVGPTGRVIAFEPAPESVSLLRKSVAVNRLANVSVEAKALSDRPGTLTLHLHGINRAGHSIHGMPGEVGFVEVESVPLDDRLSAVPGAIGLVKIDVEGAEGLVLAGMRETLRTRAPRALIVEFTPTGIRRTGLDPADVLHGLLAAGYRVRTLGLWTGESVSLDETSARDLLQRLEAERAQVDLVFERDRASAESDSDGTPRDPLK